MPSSYLIHVSDGCPFCDKAKFLLDQTGNQYYTTNEYCGEWPTVPAIYKISGDQKELIGGYDQLLVKYFKHGLGD